MKNKNVLIASAHSDKPFVHGMLAGHRDQCRMTTLAFGVFNSSGEQITKIELIDVRETSDGLFETHSLKKELEQFFHMLESADKLVVHNVPGFRDIIYTAVYQNHLANPEKLMRDLVTKSPATIPGKSTPTLAEEYRQTVGESFNDSPTQEVLATARLFFGKSLVS